MPYPSVPDFRIKTPPLRVEEVQRIAQKQLRYVSSVLHSGKYLHKGVHESRKSFKRLRALLRLMRPALSPDVYVVHNQTIGSISRQLSELRDAAVLVACWEKYRAVFIPYLDATQWDKVLQLLVSKRDALTKAARKQGLFDVVRKQTADYAASILQWSISSPEPDLWAHAMQRIYRSGLKRMLLATDQRSAEHLHEWRKMVKHLLYHVELLQGCWPPVMLAWKNELQQLSELLGEDHDLFVLTELLKGDVWWKSHPDQHRKLLGAVQRQRHQLQRRAFQLGELLYAESPPAFGLRLEAWLTAWQEPVQTKKSISPDAAPADV